MTGDGRPGTEDGKFVDEFANYDNFGFPGIKLSIASENVHFGAVTHSTSSQGKRPPLLSTDCQ
jgi:hypothetical protein